MPPDIAQILAVRDHVLVKGWHDSGTIEAVYGPYTKAQAEWYVKEFAELGGNNWTVVPLRDFAEPDPEVAR